MCEFKKNVENGARASYRRDLALKQEEKPGESLFVAGAGVGADLAARDLLNWMLKLTGTGQTPGMMRLMIHNRLVELTGDGERA